MNDMPTKSIKKFYTLLFSGKISESEKTLEYIKRKLGEENPYYNALYGIYYSYVNDDLDSYVFKLWERYLNGVDKKTLQSEIQKLIDESYEPPNSFLQAWIDLVNIIDQLPTPHKIEKKEAKPIEESIEETEIVEDLEGGEE